MAVISAKIEPLRSMESSPSTRLSEEALESLSGAVSPTAYPSNRPFSADRSNSSPSHSRESEIQPQPSARSEEYRQLFRLPPEEVLIEDFNCALQENFLLQGHMYLFNHYICFYSNIFGFETKKVIPFHEVTSVRRAKVAGIFPTAIEIMVGEKKYFFTSFLSRDEAFKLITKGWSDHGKQDIQSEFNNHMNETDITEDAVSPEYPLDELESSERDKDISLSADSKPPPDGEPETIPISPRVEDIIEERTEAVVNVESSLSSVETPGWAHENSDAPIVPEDYTKVAEAKFQIPMEEFFNLFFSNDAVGFLESFHGRCGDTDFKCSSWYRHDESWHARDVSFQHPIKIYFGAKFGSCQEVQKFRLYSDSHLVVETSQVVRNVPYGDYFSVEGLWDVKRDANESNDSCILMVYVRVSFSKKTMWKAKIVQSTLEECRDAYSTWINSALDLLKQTTLEKKAGGSAADVAPNGQGHQEMLRNSVEPLGRSEGPGNLGTSQRLPDLGDVNKPIGDPLRIPLGGVRSLMSSFSEAIMNFDVSLKSQNQVPIILVITFTLILLLMQLSIVVLLSRPQQVQVIHYADYASSMRHTGERGPEMLMWLEKRIDYLKEEIRMVETLLEKFRHEHTLLKEQVRDLENFRRQLIS